MRYLAIDLQARVNALEDKAKLKVDGMMGPKTRAAVKKLVKERGGSKVEDIFDISGLHRIHWHWTAGTYEVTADTCAHYNDVHDYEGNSYDGRFPAQHQAMYDWRKGIGVSHTRGSNTGCIGQSVACMAGSSGWPVSWGKYPITWEGIDAMLERSAHYCKEFDIPVTKWSTLTHAEIEPILGIQQRGKWDIRLLPGDEKLRDPIEAGDILRKRLIEKFM